MAKIPKVTPRRVLWALLVAEVVLIVVSTRPWMGGDSQNYLALGREMLDGRYGTVRDGVFVPETQHPPLYPAFLAVLIGLARLPILAVVVAQALLFLSGVYLVQRLLARHGLARAQHLFLVIVLVYPATIAHSTMIMSEALSIFLLAAIVYTVGAPGSLTYRRAGAAGVLTGLAILCRPTLVLLPVFLAPAFILIFKRTAAWRRLLVSEAAFLALVLVVLAPYAAVNHRQLGTPTVLPPGAAAGYSIYASTWSLDGRVASIADQPSFTADSERIRQRIEAAEPEPSGAGSTVEGDPGTQQSKREVRASRVFLGEALERVWQNPGRYATHVAYNWWRLWNTADYPGSIPALVRLGIQLSAAATWALGMVGSALLLLRRWRSSPSPKDQLVVIAVLTLYFPVVLAWLESGSRYTAPGQLLLQACAALAIAELTSRFAARRALARPVAGVTGSHPSAPTLAGSPTLVAGPSRGR